MPKKEIHHHTYRYDEDMEDIAERLTLDKYEGKLRKWREEAKEGGYTTIRVQGHRYTLDFHHTDLSFELIPFNGKEEKRDEAGDEEEDE